MKCEVKWIDGQWNAFLSAEGSCRSRVLRSAGVLDIVDQVEQAWPPLEDGYEIGWRVSGNKFVVTAVPKKSGKLSKSKFLDKRG